MAASDQCPTKKEAESKFPGQHLYWHTEAHCWDANPVINGEYKGYQRTATDVDVPPPKPEPKITVLKVKTVYGRFMPWDERINGVEFLKSLIGE